MSTEFSLAAVRAATPGVDEVIHVNNAGSALPPTVVTDTVVDYLRREEAIGGYEAADEADGGVDVVPDLRGLDVHLQEPRPRGVARGQAKVEDPVEARAHLAHHPSQSQFSMVSGMHFL